MLLLSLCFTVHTDSNSVKLASSSLSLQTSHVMYYSITNSPLILPKLICLTAPGFNRPFLVSGTFASCSYLEYPPPRLEAVGAASHRRSRREGCCVLKMDCAAKMEEMPRPRERGRGCGRRCVRRMRADIVVVEGEGICERFKGRYRCRGC